MASSTLQCWSLALGAYRYSIIHRPGKDHSNADALSHLPLSDSTQTVPVPGDILMTIEQLNSTPVNANQIKDGISRDPIPSRVRRYVHTTYMDGLSETDESFLPYKRRKDKLSIEDGCILLGFKMVSYLRLFVYP